jgi:hypothetical protein
MNRVIIFIAVFLTAIISDARAQSLSPTQDTLVWQVDQITDILSDTIMSYQASFESYGSQRIEWIQQQSNPTVFEIESVDGSWTDVESNGTLAYSIHYQNKAGEMSVTRSTNGIVISLRFNAEGIVPMNLQFRVTAVNKKQL